MSKLKYLLLKAYMEKRQNSNFRLDFTGILQEFYRLDFVTKKYFWRALKRQLRTRERIPIAHSFPRILS